VLNCTLVVYYNFTRTYAKRAKPKKMPPKQAAQEKVLLGRPGNNLKSGIVGCA